MFYLNRNVVFDLVYDSVPYEALWRFLAKYGVSPSMLSVICSLHDGMNAEVTVDGQVAPDLESIMVCIRVVLLHLLSSTSILVYY